MVAQEAAVHARRSIVCLEEEAKLAEKVDFAICRVLCPQLRRKCGLDRFLFIEQRARTVCIQGTLALCTDELSCLSSRPFKRIVVPTVHCLLVLDRLSNEREYRGEARSSCFVLPLGIPHFTAHEHQHS